MHRRNFLGLSLALPAMAAAQSAAAQTTHVVRITNFRFEPADLSIAAGDIVQFVNEDSAPHTATDTNGAFDTGTLQRGQAVSLRFPSAGSFSYFCEIHPNMRGTLTIS